MIVDLKTEAVHALLSAELHPYQSIDGERPKVWARGARHVFLFDADIERCIGYVEDNPEKHGLRRQRWSFVTSFRRERE